MEDQHSPDVPESMTRSKKSAYEPPQLRKYGSLAELTRSGTGTINEPWDSARTTAENL